MAKRLFFVSGGEYQAVQRRMHEIVRRLIGYGSSLNPQFVLERLQDLAETGAKDDQTSRTPATPMHALVHGLFAPTDVKLRNVKRWNQERRWGFTQDDFDALPKSPAFPKARLTTVTLVPYLNTWEETYTELVSLAINEHWNVDVLSRAAVGLSRRQKVCLCGTSFAKGLRWEVIDMGGGYDWPAPRGGHPQAIPERELLAHAGVIAEIAHSPFWARSFGYRDVPGVMVGGFTFEDEQHPAPREEGDRFVMKEGWSHHVFFDHDPTGLGWHADMNLPNHEWHKGHLAIPVLMK